MADLSLKYLLFGEDKTASKAIKGVADTTEKSGSRMSGASKAIAAGAIAAGAAVVAFGKDSVDAYVEASAQHRVLEDAYRRFPAIADVSIQSMDDQANALQNVTKFEGDSISAMQGSLAQYKLTGTQIQQLTPLILDYAEKTGKDLPEASQVIGKALMGQGRALKEVGINFHDTGSTAGNFTELMGGLRKQVGGFAEQEGKSAEGRAAILKNKFGDMQEAIGEKLLPAIEFTVSGLTKLVDVGGTLIGVVSGVPKPVLAAVTAFTALHVLRGPVGGFAEKVATSLRPMNEHLRLSAMYAKDAGGGLTGLKAGLSAMTGGVSAGKTALGGLKAAGSGLFGLMGGPWGAALMGATALVGAYAQAQANAKADVDDLTGSIDKQTGQWTKASREIVANKISFDVSPEDLKSLQDAGVQISKVTDAVLYGGPPLDALNAQLDGLAMEAGPASKAADGLGKTILRERDAAVAAYAQHQANNSLMATTATTTTSTATAQKGLASATKNTAEAAKKEHDRLQELNDKLAETYQKTLDARGANRDYEAALDDATAAIKANGKTLNVHTDAGRKNQAALDNLAKSAIASAEADIKQGASTAAVTAKMKTARQAFIDTAVKMGMQKGAAGALATQLGLTSGQVQALTNKVKGVPNAKKVDVSVPTGKAVGQTVTIQRSITGINGKTVTVSVPTNTPARQASRIRGEIASIQGKNVPVSISVSGLAALQRAATTLNNLRGAQVHANVADAMGRNAGGTSNWRGGLTWVGEQGPEIVDLPGGSKVYNAQRSAAMAGAGGGGGGPVVVQAQLYLDGRMIQQSLLRVKRQTGAGLGLG
ncbi:MAG TPA: hypothetical protein VGF17_27540 [Phytomonospora sp.]